MIQIQFDNVHLTRDNPNVASDLEQMPHLYNFLKSNGVVLANTHDDLVHTATNFISNQTGLYPDRTGITQSNSFSYYDSAGATHTGVSFAYWTDPLYDPSGSPADTRYNIEYAANRADVPSSSDVNAPAPWVPYTRAGCNVGEVGMSNTVLENLATDIPTVFGPGSPQAAEAAANPDQGDRRHRRPGRPLRGELGDLRERSRPTRCPTSRAATPVTARSSATRRSSRSSAPAGRSSPWTARPSPTRAATPASPASTR